MFHMIDDDLSSSDSESEDFSAEIMKIDMYRENVLKNPLDYDSHCKLINALKHSEKMIEARESRETMHIYYPLSPEMWIDWINDEKSINSDKDFIRAIFLRAIEDYKSVDVWFEYCQFMLGYLTDKEEIRQFFEVAIAQVGTHLTKGYLIWGTYLIYEKSPFVDDGSNEQKERIYKIYLRQLSLSLQSNDETLKEFLEWNQENKEWENEICAKHELSKQKLINYLPFEDKIANIETEYAANATSDSPESKEMHWIEYLKYFESNCSKIEILNLYERAITDLCLSQNIWISYLKYLSQHFEQDEERILKAYQRAVRNYKSSLELWIGYVRHMEMYNCSVDEIRTTFNLIFRQNLNDQTPFIPLWQAYLDFEKRQLDKQSKDNVDLTIIRELFDKLITIENYIDYDPQCSLVKYWTFIEAKYAGNMPKSRELWSLIMKSLGNSNSSLWLENIEFERKFGDFEHLKRLANTAVNCFTDYPEYLCERILRIVAEESDLKTYLQFTKKIDTQRKKISERRMKEEAENPTKPQKRKTPDYKSSGLKAKKVKFSEELSTETVTASVSIEQPIERCEEKTIFVSNLKYSVNENDLRQKFEKCGKIAEIRIQKDSHDKSRGFAFIQFDSQSTVEEALKLERELLLERPMFVSRCNSSNKHSFSYSVGVVEANKLFVKNLPKNVTKYALENIFKQFGALKEIRLVTFKSGLPKGIAYVEYSNENDASKALVGTDGMEIGDRVIEVNLSKPPVKESPKKDGESSSQSIDFKPPIGMIPRTVGLKPMATQKKIIHGASSDSQDGNIAEAKKSNADFRKFLM